MNKWDIRFLQLARLVASWSKDPSTKTGAVIANYKQFIAAGYNGFPQGMVDAPERYANREEKYSRIIHCEINALIFAGKVPFGSTLYTWPFMSCDRCVVQMLQAGVRRFVAPSPSEDALTRWGSAFERTKDYITECGATWLEIPIAEVP